MQADLQVKIDEYDRKILLELYKDSREGASVIGRRIRLSRENVNYRIKRLENQGLIREYNTYFNETALGLKRFVFCIQLINLRGETEHEIMDFLKKHHCVTWLGPAAGKWSVIFDVVIHQDKKVIEVINNFFTKYEKNIGAYISFPAEEEKTYFYKVISSAEDSAVKRKIKNNKIKLNKIKLDDIDWKILKELNEDARVSYVALSQKTNLTANAIKKRVKNLESAGIIDGYTISIDIRKLGYEWYTLNLNLAKFGEETENKLKSFFKMHKNVIFYCRDNGVWEYDVGIFAKNSGELREFINELRAKFAEEIRIADVFVILEEVKGYKLPSGVFQ
jgi:Lrp/AsnC family transcriptional regulator, leucine-responsive regulatory protein